jgi:hypothetical protein
MERMTLPGFINIFNYIIISRLINHKKFDRVVENEYCYQEWMKLFANANIATTRLVEGMSEKENTICDH